MGVFALLAASQAMADPVVYQSVPDLLAGTNASWCSDCYGGGVYEPLDQFTLSSGATITSFDLAQQLYGQTTDFTIEIYNSDHSAIVFSQAVSATLTYEVNNTVIAHASVTGLSLASGTYWAGFIAPVMYLQGFDTGNGSLIDSTPPHTGGGTFALGGNTGYIFYGAAEGGVPEPASWAMMVGGFGLVGGAMRRRKTTISFA